MNCKKNLMSTVAIAIILSVGAVKDVKAQSLPEMPTVDSTNQAGSSFQGNGFPISEVESNQNNITPQGTTSIPEYTNPSVPMDNMGNPRNNENGTNLNNGPRFDENGFIMADDDPTSDASGGVFQPRTLESENTVPVDDIPYDVMTNMENGGFQNQQPSDPNMMGGQQIQQESPIPGGPTEFERPEPTLPLKNEEMSLSNFDQFYSDLIRDVESRLGELDTQNIGSEVQRQQSIRDQLPNASVGEYENELEKMSAVQREIRMLQLRLQQAQLAKEVYDTIYPDELEVYENRITELEEHIVKQDAEQKEKIAEVESEKQEVQALVGDLEFQVENLKSQMSEVSSTYEAKIAELEDKLDDAEEKAEEAELKAETAEEKLDYLGGAGPGGGTGTFVNSDGQLIMGPSTEDGQPLFNTEPPGPNVSTQANNITNTEEDDYVLLPGVTRLSCISGRCFAQVEMPPMNSGMGEMVNISLGSILPNEMEVIELNSERVVVKTRKGEEYPLPRGRAERPIEQNNMMGNGGVSPAQQPPAPMAGSNQITDPEMGLLPEGYNPYGVPTPEDSGAGNPGNMQPGQPQENIVMPISPPSNF